MGHGAFGQIGLLSGRAERVQNAESSNHRHSDRRQTSIRPLIMILILLTSDQCECRLSRRCFLLLNEDCNTTAHTASLTSGVRFEVYSTYSTTATCAIAVREAICPCLSSLQYTEYSSAAAALTTESETCERSQTRGWNAGRRCHITLLYADRSFAGCRLSLHSVGKRQI